MTTYYGWVPNLSGKVSSGEKLSTFNQHVVRHYYDQDGRFELEFIFLSSPTYPLTLRINRTDINDEEIISTSTYEFEFLDDAGLCMLDSDYTQFEVNEVWSELRHNLDGCSDRVTNCVAMNNMIVSDGLNNPGMKDICEGISQRFIDSLERDGDFATYVVDKGKFVTNSNTEPSYVSRAVYQSNALYLEAFLSFYGTHLSKDKIDYLKRTSEFRVRKNDIIANHFDNDHRAKVETGMSRLTLLGIAVALGIGVASIVLAAYGIYM